MSEHKWVSSGVLQRYVLGPVLFNIYVLPLGKIVMLWSCLSVLAFGLLCFGTMASIWGADMVSLFRLRLKTFPFQSESTHCQLSCYRPRPLREVFVSCYRDCCSVLVEFLSLFPLHLNSSLYARYSHSLCVSLAGDDITTSEAGVCSPVTFVGNITSSPPPRSGPRT